MNRSRTLAVLLAALLVVAGLDLVAYAANGRPLLLGHRNAETRSATLRNTGHGPALRIRTRAGSPPLAVSSGTRVPRLNADRVDGYEASRLGVQVRRYLTGGDGDESDVMKSFPGLPHGLYWVRYEFHATYDYGLDCWLDDGTGVQVLPTSGDVDDPLVAEGLVDARDGVTMRCRAGGIFDSGSSGGSWIDFWRLTVGTVQGAETTAW